MKIRHRESETSIETPMTPMIDVVFQLLVFFLFTFKIVPVEGEMGVNMPPLDAGTQQQSEEIDPIERIGIRLRSDGTGNLAQILLDANPLGTSPQTLTAMLKENFVGLAPSADDIEVELDVDRELFYAHVIRVASAIQTSGITKINFKDPAEPPP